MSELLADARAADPAVAAATATLHRHRLEPRTFTALGAGRGGAAAVRVLRAGQLSKRALLLTAVVRAADQRAPAAAEQAGLARAFGTVCRWQHEDPERWTRLLLQPQLDAWAADSLRKLYSGAPARLTGLAEFLAEQHPAEQHPAEQHPAAQHPAEQHPAAQPPAEQHPAAQHPAAQPPAEQRPAESANRPGRLVRLECDDRRWELRIDDSGRSGELYGKPLAAPLDQAELSSWTTLLAGAWEVLVRRHPWHAEAVAAGLDTLVPLRPAPDGSALSAAARRAYGAVAASRPAEPVLLALTLVHEFLHVQLGALMDLVPLHGPDSAARYPAPWRPDLRPAGALLQGTYAHLGVADFWFTERQAGPAELRHRAAREHALWRDHAATAADCLLGSGELTGAGTEFVRTMAATLVGWDTPPGVVSEPVPDLETWSVPVPTAEG